MAPPEIRTGRLDVYLRDALVGRIDYTSRHNVMRFAYDADYLARSDAEALSFSLPLQAEAFDSDRTTVYPNLSRVNAMSIGGAKTLEEVSRENFSRMADEAGMRPQLVLGRLDALAKRIVPAARALAAEMDKAWPSLVYAKIVDTIERGTVQVL